MLNVVGLKEAVDLCLAEHRGAGKKPHVNGTSDEIRAAALGENTKAHKMLT